MVKLNRKDYEILDFIYRQNKANGFPPSVREICQAVGLSSTATIYNRIKKLENAGYIEKGTAKNRALKIINYTPEGERAPEPDMEYVQVPIYGKVAAGIPITAVQEWDATMPLPADFVGNRDLFILKVQGDSMINAAILDGDYIIVRHQPDAENGDIVVALVDNNEEATVKTFYRETGRFRLQPENDTMEPIYVESLSVLGKVVGVFRSL